MEQFSYSFAVSMMHSIWQSAILLVIYFVATLALRNPHPLFKRNLLYGFAATQVLLSILTFTIYHTGGFETLQLDVRKIMPGTILQKVLLQQYAPWIFYAYSMIVLYKGIGNTRNWMLFKKNYTIGLIKPAAEIKVFTASKALHFGILKKVTLWYSNTIEAPVVFGFLKPVILLPVALINQLTVEETESLIIHELSHIRNNDYLLNWLLLIVETIYFFNPFVRIMATKIRLEREKNCDVQVLQFEYSNFSYAAALLKAARHNGSVKNFQLAAVFNRSQLLMRIRFFSNEKNLDSRQGNSMFFSLAGLFVLLTFTLSVLSKPTATVLSGSLTNIQLPFVQEKTANFSAAPVNEIEITKPLELAESRVNKKSSKYITIDDKLSGISVENSIELLKPEVTQGINIVPVSYKSNLLQQVNEGRQVIINEESSNGKMITKAYNVKLKDGKWISEPLWIIAESKPTDSLRKKMVDSLIHVVPEVQ